jgi:hypothetical protein
LIRSAHRGRAPWAGRVPSRTTSTPNVGAATRVITGTDVVLRKIMPRVSEISALTA